jgi:hypothetical protein
MATASAASCTRSSRPPSRSACARSARVRPRRRTLRSAATPVLLNQSLTDPAQIEGTLVTNTTFEHLTAPTDGGSDPRDEGAHAGDGFRALVGEYYHRHGIDALHAWLADIFDPLIAVARAAYRAWQRTASPPPRKRFKYQDYDVPATAARRLVSITYGTPRTPGVLWTAAKPSARDGAELGPAGPICGSSSLACLSTASSTQSLAPARLFSGSAGSGGGSEPGFEFTFSPHETTPTAKASKIQIDQGLLQLAYTT